jgi:hypothetical protein
VRMYKIQWSHHTEEEATSETSNTSTPSIRDSCNLETVSCPSHLIVLKSNLGTRFRLRGVGCDAPGF